MSTYPTLNACRQIGAATLATALILLLCTTLVVLYAAKQGVIEQWISGNEYRYNSAFASAEAGLDEAIALYKQNSAAVVNNGNPAGCIQSASQPGSAPASWGGARYCTTLAAQNINGKTFYNFASQGTSDDYLASVYVYKQIGFGSFVKQATPASPIIDAGTVGSGGNFNIGVNPNGGGYGVPVSIWSSGAATFSGSSATCQLQYISGQACPNGGSGSSNLLSQTGSVGLDVVQNAALDTAGGTFPSDVFAYLFGVPSSQYQTVRSEAKQIINPSQCSTVLNTQSKGLYWVEDTAATGGPTGATCTLGNVGQADNTATSAFDPNAVILVLDNVPMKQNANSSVYGYVMAFSPDTPPTASNIQINGGATIFGSFLSNYDMGTHLNGTMGVVWADYGGLFANPNSPDYGVVATLPGGWRDF